MRWIDLLRLPLSSLGHQKMRTCLTTMGVVFGAFVLAASLSIDEGVQRTIDRESSKGDVARKVTVHSAWRQTETKPAEEVKVNGRMRPERRDRISRSLEAQAKRGDQPQELIALTPERLSELGQLPHVRKLVPIVQTPVVATLGNRPVEALVSSGAGEDPEFPKRLVVGRAFESEDEHSVLLSEMFAYRIGLVDDADLDQVLGRPLRLEIRGQEKGQSLYVSLANRAKSTSSREENLALNQLAWQLPGLLDRFSLTEDERAALNRAIVPLPDRVVPSARVVDDFRVVGVFRELTEQEEKEAWSQFPARSDLVLPRQTATELALRTPDLREAGINQAVLYVDDMKNVKSVVEKVRDMGLNGRSIIEFLDRERLTYLLVFGGMTCVAGVALLVAALGIANTMLMSVLERRREIGIMKSVGAANWQLLTVFVIEGALIGLTGGSLGLLLAWSTSFPADTWIRSMVHKDMQIHLTGSIYAFPTWINTTVILCTVGVTILAALYPARRAAMVDPVSALRHE